MTLHLLGAPSFVTLLLVLLATVPIFLVRHRRQLGSSSHFEARKIIRVANRGERGGQLPVYWMNLDESTDRREAMILHFEDLKANGYNVIDKRVRALNSSNIESMIAYKQLAMNGVQLNEPSDVPVWMMHKEGAYLYTEAACTFTHLMAIQQAYDDGHEYALFIEDDIHLNDAFLEQWWQYAALAPDDWNALQWFTTAVEHQLRGKKMQDHWISWQPDHYGCHVYMINRRGMEEILSRSIVKRSDGSWYWRLEEPYMMVADEVVYVLARKSYTSTYPWWTRSVNLSSTIRNFVETNQNFVLHPGIEYEDYFVPTLDRYIPSNRSKESILVVSTFRSTTAAQIQEEIQRLLTDSKVLAQYHQETRWMIRAVLTDASLQPTFKAEVSRLPHNVEVSASVQDGRFNKFEWVSKCIPAMKKYTYVLVKDNDMRLAGFPWRSFMQLKGNSLISSPIRESLHSSLLRETYKCIDSDRNWYRLHDASIWKRNRWLYEMHNYKQISAIPAPFLEEYFVLMDGTFAEWFFTEVLTDSYIGQPVDWGVDKMWCGAASQYDPDREPCVLLPLISEHEDTRQVSNDESYRKDGQELMQRLRKVEKFNMWFSMVNVWDKVVGGQTWRNMIHNCGILTNHTIDVNEFDLPQCARDAWAATFSADLIRKFKPGAKCWHAFA